MSTSSSEAVERESDRAGTSFGRFELLERIGVGGMAEVWKARVAGVGGFEKILVLKKILPAFAQNKTFVEMLLAEARLCAVLQHTNIVQTYENGEIGGQFYIAMEYVKGHDLFKVLSRATKVGRRIPVELCLFVAAEVAKGLAYAHSAKDNDGRTLHIIHRDVSPSNVLISETGEVKVMDFGVARATMDGAQNDNRSRAGVLKGKLGYMSPEQVTGQPFDFRSDIFSLGIILYESITLKRLFLGRTDLETLVNIRDARIEHKFRKHNYIEEPVRALLRKALARNPDDRYASALDFHDDIVNLLFQQKTQVTNRRLAAFLADVFADQSESEAEEPVRPASGSAPKSQNSLTFSPEEIRKQQAEIRRRRAEQLQARTVAPAPEEGHEVGLGTVAPDTAVELSGVPARRTSRQIPVPNGVRAELDQAFVHTAPDAVTAGMPRRGSGEHGDAQGRGRTRASGRRPQAMPVGTFARDTDPNAAGLNAGQAVVPPPRRVSTGGVSSDAVPGRGSGTRRAPENFRLRTGDGHVVGPLAPGALETMVRNRTVGPGAEVAVDEESFRDIEEFSQLRRVINETVGARGDPDRTGETNRLNFPRLVYELFAERMTGCLELHRDAAVKSIYFRKGRPVHIASNQMAEMLGTFLVSQGIISQQDVELAVESSNRGGGRLGDVLVAMNLIKPYQLYQVLEKQFREKFIDAFGWETADWALYLDDRPPSTTVPLDLDPVSALLEAVRSKVPLSILEPYFQPHLDRRYRRLHGSRITVEALRFQAREAKALGLLMASETLREALEERCRSRQQRLAILHVLLLLTQTDLLAFEDAN